MHENFKSAIVQSDDTATILVSNPGRPTMRVLRNGRTEAPDSSGSGDLASVLELYFSGDMEASVANTGQTAARIDAVLPVADIIKEAWEGCVAAMEKGRTRLGRPSA